MRLGLGLTYFVIWGLSVLCGMCGGRRRKTAALADFPDTSVSAFFCIANWFRFGPVEGAGLIFLARLVIYIHIFADWQSIGHGRCIWPFPGSNLVRTAYGNGFRGSRPLSAHKGDIYMDVYI